MKPKRYLIIGAGQAGCKAALTLRAEDPDCFITLIGDEPHKPYERPQLSKGVLAGTMNADRLFMVSPDYFAQHHIVLLTSSVVETIDPRAKEVSLASGMRVSYDKLLLTTGSKVRQLRVPGSHLGGVHYLRTLDQALALHDHIATAKHLVVIGAGFIGLEVAATARQFSSCTVTVVEAGDNVLQRGVPREMREQILQLHRSHGVDFRFDKKVVALHGDPKKDGSHVTRVECHDGEALDADCVVIGIGVEPRVELAQQAGIAVQNGLVVNQHCETSSTDIYAAGEVTSHWNAQLDEFIRLESWQTAELQPVCAAQNMLGRVSSYSQIPWFWTDQYGVNIQLVGVLSSGREFISRHYDDSRFIYFYFTNNKLIGAFAFNAGKDIRVTQKMIETGITPDPEALADPNQDLRKILKSNASKTSLSK